MSSVIRSSVNHAYSGNGHQHDPKASTNKLAAVFRAWGRSGFSLVDRGTWQLCSSRSLNPSPVTISWSDDEFKALGYFAQILNCDVNVAANATGDLLHKLAANATGEMTVKYVKTHLQSHGIRCGHHGKVNEYLNALAQAGWIEQVGSYVVGRKGKRWCVGERQSAKCADNSLLTQQNPSPIYTLCPINNNDHCNSVVDGSVNNLWDGSFEQTDKLSRPRHGLTEGPLLSGHSDKRTPQRSIVASCVS